MTQGDKVAVSDAQNPLMRRAYLIRPRAELEAAIHNLGLSEDTEYLMQTVVTMTEALPYEGKLEGFRSLILAKCKEAFLRDLFEYAPLSDNRTRSALLGDFVTTQECFDRWWTAEEIETVEIPTTW
jgi:hypothetical protein